ncbi:MAG: hypothetical protein JW955_04555, partial [Sedimentisphaerales bacterium]|nr:hypothetical protein [Sedimentisphaerales bacterium]
MAVAQVRPSLAGLDVICVDTPAPPTAMVVFGASGDLAHRKLLPSLAQIQQRGLLSEHFCLVGCGRTQCSDEQFRRDAERSIRENATSNTSADAINAVVQ